MASIKVILYTKKTYADNKLFDDFLTSARTNVKEQPTKKYCRWYGVKRSGKESRWSFEQKL